jgi:hypothetical protein
MPNESQHQVACELQGQRIEAPGLPALMLLVNTRRWVLADNNGSANLAGAHPSHAARSDPLSMNLTR